MSKPIILLGGTVLIIAASIVGTYSIIRSNDNQPKPIAAQAPATHYAFTINFTNGASWQADNVVPSQFQGGLSVIQGTGSAAKIIAIEFSPVKEIIPNQ